MSTDAIVLLRQDHTELKRLFREFKETGPDAHAAKGRLVDRMIALRAKAPTSPAQPGALKKALHAVIG